MNGGDSRAGKKTMRVNGGKVLKIHIKYFAASVRFPLSLFSFDTNHVYFI
jgi:hypothetical protein